MKQEGVNAEGADATELKGKVTDFGYENRLGKSVGKFEPATPRINRKVPFLYFG